MRQSVRYDLVRQLSKDKKVLVIRWGPQRNIDPKKNKNLTSRLCLDKLKIATGQQVIGNEIKMYSVKLE